MNTTQKDNGYLAITLLDDGDGWMGTSTDGAIWVELTFTAKTDGNTGDYFPILIHLTHFLLDKYVLQQHQSLPLPHQYP